VLEAAVPVLRHLRAVGSKNTEDLLNRLLVDHATEACTGSVLGRDHHGHVVVQDLDREVLTGLPEDVLLLLPNHLARAVMRIDHMVTDFELDELYRLGDEVFDVQVFELIFLHVRQGVPSLSLR
jgi:hypothetical protein